MQPLSPINSSQVATNHAGRPIDQASLHPADGGTACDPGDHKAPAASSQTLADAPIGQHCRVLAVGGTGLMRRRLMDLGVMPDAEITLLRAAPLNDPIEIRVGNAFVSLRRTEAALIEVAAQ
ncbi:MAG: FeoA family protein [Brachymonas sp.]|nr:FeoA family protein [Brachymonas sp.]MDO4795622.1 FeoA family protein [Brachymonas sp.]